MGKIKEKNLSVMESIGAICFIGLAFLGLFILIDPGNNTAFFNNFLVNTNYLFGVVPTDVTSAAANINTAGVLPLMNFAVGLKVIAGLFAIILVMAHATTSYKEGKK